MTTHRLTCLLAMLAGCSGPGPTPDAGAPDAATFDAGSTADAGACGPCGGDTPVCDDSVGECVGCLADTDCAAPAALCDRSTLTCAGCATDADCTDPAAARCDAGACAPCATDEHCAGLADAGVCDAGACVECTVADETPCAGNSCDPATLACTTTPRGMTNTCGSCAADSECVADHRCVPMTFAGAAYGSYCMRMFSSGCDRPFLGLLRDRVSVSGAPAADYCGIDEANVSCDAVLARRSSRTCPDGLAATCMADGARCERVGAALDRCTYTCGTPDDCPAVGAASTCSGGYCGS